MDHHELRNSHGPARVRGAVAEPPYASDLLEAPQQPPDQASAEVPPPAQWQAPFLAALRTKSTVSEACRTVGVELTIVYEERERVPAFAQAWDEARGHALMAMGGAMYIDSENKARRRYGPFWLKLFARGYNAH